MKFVEVNQKYSATRRIFNSLLGVWKSGPTRSFVFDILIPILDNLLNISLVNGIEILQRQVFCLVFILNSTRMNIKKKIKITCYHPSQLLLGCPI